MKLHSLRDSRSSVEWIPVFQYMWMWMWSNPLTNQPSRGTLRRRHPAHEPAMIRWYLEKEAGYLDWVGGGTPPTFAVAAVRCGGSQKSVVLIAALPGGNEILDVLRSGVHILSHIPPIQKHLANICSTSVVVVCGFCDIRAGLCELACDDAMGGLYDAGRGFIIWRKLFSDAIYESRAIWSFTCDCMQWHLKLCSFWEELW